MAIKYPNNFVWHNYKTGTVSLSGPPGKRGKRGRRGEIGKFLAASNWICENMPVDDLAHECFYSFTYLANKMHTGFRE